MPTPLQEAIFYSDRPQREIAREAGISEGYLSKLAAGTQHAPDATRAKIAKAVRRPVSELWPENSNGHGDLAA